MQATNEAPRKGQWMQTFTGRLYWPEDPRPGDFDIKDVAHSLANICRYGGHCHRFYSVCEHSCRVSLAVKYLGGTSEEQYEALLHDAVEAYIGDVVWPLKRAPDMAGYLIIEKRNEIAFGEQFGLAPKQPGIVKHCDLVLLATEKRDLFGGRDLTKGATREHAAATAKLGEWAARPPEPLETKITWISYGKDDFLARFHELCRETGRSTHA